MNKCLLQDLMCRCPWLMKLWGALGGLLVVMGFYAESGSSLLLMALLMYMPLLTISIDQGRFLFASLPIDRKEVERSYFILLVALPALILLLAVMPGYIGQLIMQQGGALQGVQFRVLAYAICFGGFAYSLGSFGRDRLKGPPLEAVGLAIVYIALWLTTQLGLTFFQGLWGACGLIVLTCIALFFAWNKSLLKTRPRSELMWLLHLQDGLAALGNYPFLAGSLGGGLLLVGLAGIALAFSRITNEPILLEPHSLPVSFLVLQYQLLFMVQFAAVKSEGGFKKKIGGLFMLPIPKWVLVWRVIAAPLGFGCIFFPPFCWFVLRGHGDGWVLKSILLILLLGALRMLRLRNLVVFPGRETAPWKTVFRSEIFVLITFSSVFFVHQTAVLLFVLGYTIFEFQHYLRRVYALFQTKSIAELM